MSTITVLAAGAVHTYQSDWLAALPAWPGSPASAEALRMLPVAPVLVPESVMAFAKLSLLAGAVCAGAGVESAQHSAAASARTDGIRAERIGQPPCCSWRAACQI